MKGRVREGFLRIRSFSRVRSHSGTPMRNAARAMS